MDPEGIVPYLQRRLPQLQQYRNYDPEAFNYTYLQAQRPPALIIMTGMLKVCARPPTCMHVCYSRGEVRSFSLTMVATAFKPAASSAAFQGRGEVSPRSAKVTC